MTSNSHSNTPHSFLKTLLLIALTLTLTPVLANTGKAVSIEGAVLLNGVPMTLSDEVKQGDIIKTAPDSQVNITMADGTVINVTEDSEFKFNKYRYIKGKESESKSVFNILKGGMRFISGLISKANPKAVVINAGTATIGIRGTWLTVEGVTTGSTGDGNAVITTSVGIVDITFADGSSFSAPAGQSFTTSTKTVRATTAPDPLFTAAQALAADPDADISNLTDAGKTLAVAGLIANATALGASQEQINNIISSVVATNPSLAATVVLMASSVDPDNASSYANTAIVASGAETGSEAANDIITAAEVGGGLGVGVDISGE